MPHSKKPMKLKALLGTPRAMQFPRHSPINTIPKLRAAQPVADALPAGVLDSLLKEPKKPVNKNRLARVDCE